MIRKKIFLILIAIGVITNLLLGIMIFVEIGEGWGDQTSTVKEGGSLTVIGESKEKSTINEADADEEHKGQTVSRQKVEDRKKQEDNVEAREGVLFCEGDRISTRYRPPEGYQRVVCEKGSFGEYLQNYELEPYGTEAMRFDKTRKPSAGSYDSVLKMELSNMDLQQCADSIMLLRGEYLFSKGAFREIHFHFVDGFECDYERWMQGERVFFDKKGKPYWKKTKAPSNTHEDLLEYLEVVYTNASTISLEKELKPKKIEEMRVGDIFIRGGAPGHAAIVVDMAVNSNGDQVFMLAQGHMPAQQMEIPINHLEPAMSPWYKLVEGEPLVLPEYTFEAGLLREYE